MGIVADLPQEWDGSAIHPYRSVSKGAAAPNSLPNPKNRYKSTKNRQERQRPVGRVDPSPAEEDLGVPSAWKPAVADNGYKF